MTPQEINTIDAMRARNCGIVRTFDNRHVVAYGSDYVPNVVLNSLKASGYIAATVDGYSLTEKGKNEKI